MGAQQHAPAPRTRNRLRGGGRRGLEDLKQYGMELEARAGGSTPDHATSGGQQGGNSGGGGGVPPLPRKARAGRRAQAGAAHGHGHGHGDTAHDAFGAAQGSGLGSGSHKRRGSHAQRGPSREGGLRAHGLGAAHGGGGPHTNALSPLLRGGTSHGSRPTLARLGHAAGAASVSGGAEAHPSRPAPGLQAASLVPPTVGYGGGFLGGHGRSHLLGGGGGGGGGSGSGAGRFAFGSGGAGAGSGLGDAENDARPHTSSHSGLFDSGLEEDQSFAGSQYYVAPIPSFGAQSDLPRDSSSRDGVRGSSRGTSRQGARGNRLTGIGKH